MSLLLQHQSTIAAIATPRGLGGVGIVRVSGKESGSIARAMVKKEKLKPRFAYYLPFYGENDTILDYGIALYFSAPYSFTGEDVLELHAHGGPVVLDQILKRVLQLGAHPARAGEFCERAFLNDRIDLAQAESIIDLIYASSEQAARLALSSLQGEFSKQIDALIDAIIHLRMYVEAAIDFPEEEIDFLNEKKIVNEFEQIVKTIDKVSEAAKQGSVLREGMTVVLAGKPNVGKSSLLNGLSGREAAIVTDIAGTTRDTLREHIHIDGMPLHVVDTAGLRDSLDPIEREGVRRAWEEIHKADAVLYLIDESQTQKGSDPFIAFNQWWLEYEKHSEKQMSSKECVLIKNKIDLMGEPPSVTPIERGVMIALSAKTGEGIDLLKDHLKAYMGYRSDASEGIFMARRRHLDAIARAKGYLEKGREQLMTHHAGELFAEDLLHAQEALSEITGAFTSDDLLEKIFSSFCIGK